jgi:hypothetical protein
MSKFNERELQSVLCGSLIAEGSARKVYHCKPNSRLVVKIERSARSFQNVAESEIWSFVLGDKQMQKWFAPCMFISNAGTILIQEKVEPLRQKDLPKSLPEFLCDLKIENFGMLNDRIVCCDYGTMVYSIKRASRKLVKAVWR